MRSILLKSVKNAPMAAALAVLLHAPVSAALAQDRTQPDSAATAPGNPMPGATGTGITGTGTTGTTTGAAQPAPAIRADRPDPLMAEDVSKVRGADVRGRDDKKIGDVETVLMKPDTKQVDRVVVDVGGVLGV